MRILCGTDFSDQAGMAMELAAALAQRMGDSLELVHALEIPVPAGPVEGLVGMEQFVAAQRGAVRKALGSAAEVVSRGGLRVDTRVMDGQAARVLAEALSADDVRMGVLASHGRGAAERLALGSVADRLVELADKPVLVAGKTSNTLAEALRAKRPLRVVVGVDFGRASDAALAMVRMLRPVLPMDVTLLHAYWPPGEAQRLGLHGPADLYEADPEIQAILRTDLERKMGALPGEGRVDVRVVPNLGRPAERLIDAAQELLADLIVTGTAARAGLAGLFRGSNARALLHSYHGNILCVPQRIEEHQPTGSVPDPKHFLAATDFSPMGNRAVLTAFALARARGGSVTLVTVLPGREPPVWDLGRHVDKAPEPAHVHAEQQLRALVPAELQGVPCRVLAIAAPSSAEAVVQAAERLGADAIVLGRHGRTVVTQLVTGSVALKVLTLTRLPVVLVAE